MKKTYLFLVLLLAFISTAPLSAKHHHHRTKKIKYETKSRHVGFNFNFSPTDLFLGYALLNSEPVVRERVIVQPQPVIYQAAPHYYYYPAPVTVIPQPAYVEKVYVYR